MDHNLPLMARKIRNMVHALLFMLRKGITKSKIILELNLRLRLGKLADKAMIGNLNFRHHSHNHHQDKDNDMDHDSFSGPYEYKFSSSSTPEYFPINLKKRHKNHHLDEHDNSALKIEIEQLSNGVHASPMFPSSDKVRQVRVTDSPFPLHDVSENGNQVDKAAEEFIKKFHMQLKIGK